MAQANVPQQVPFWKQCLLVSIPAFLTAVGAVAVHLL